MLPHIIDKQRWGPMNRSHYLHLDLVTRHTFPLVLSFLPVLFFYFFSSFFTSSSSQFLPKQEVPESPRLFREISSDAKRKKKCFFCEKMSSPTSSWPLQTRHLPSLAPLQVHSTGPFTRWRCKRNARGFKTTSICSATELPSSHMKKKFRFHRHS